MRLLTLANIDDLHWHCGEGNADILLACGDIADQVILEAAQAYDCSHIFAVKGNHDFKRPFPKPIVGLHLQVKPYNGLRFGGLNGAWKYKPKGAYLYSQEDVKKVDIGTGCNRRQMLNE